MTKRERLDVLMCAAERLQFKEGPMVPERTYSCVAVREVVGRGEQYADFVGINVWSPGFLETTEQTQLARQLAVLMYREAVKRGEA